MLIKTEAIVLRHVKYGDSRMIVDLFTREAGRVSFATSVSGASKASAARRRLFVPLALLDVECDIRQGRSLQTFKSAHILYPLTSLSSDAYKLSIALFIADFLCHALRGEQRNEPLFDYIADSLQWLDSRAEGFSNFHLVFLMRLSLFLGFYPNLEDYADGCSFDMRAGCFCMSAPMHADVLPPQEAAVIRTMMRMNFSTMHLFRLSREQRNRLVEVVVRHYRLHIPSFPELRSFDILRELFV